MKATGPTNIGDYISGLPEHVQEILQKIRNLIATAAPDAQEAIKYQIPTFVLGENLVHFAAFPKHIGFYPTPSVIEAFSDRLEGYKSAKGSVQFPLEQPMPFGLIREMVEFRVKQLRKKGPPRKR